MKIESLKRELVGEELRFLENFETEIHDFFDFLNNKGVLDLDSYEERSIMFNKLIENFNL